MPPDTPSRCGDSRPGSPHLESGGENRISRWSVRRELLRSIERRARWLAVSMVHHANYVRGDDSALKRDGHKAPSFSVTTIMTTLLCHHALTQDDRVSVKPRRSAELHALNALLDSTPPEALDSLRQIGGIQSYQLDLGNVGARFLMGAVPSSTPPTSPHRPGPPQKSNPRPNGVESCQEFA